MSEVQRSFFDILDETGSDNYSIQEPAVVLPFPVSREESFQQKLKNMANVPGGREAIIDMACKLIDEKFADREDRITDPQLAARRIKARLGNLEHEEFAVLFLDNRHGVLAFETLFRGTVASASVYPREVVKEALKHNASAVILAHNHPSGECAPSQADLAITQRLIDALKLVDIRVLDHLIVGKGHHYSLSANNQI